MRGYFKKQDEEKELENRKKYKEYIFSVGEKYNIEGQVQSEDNEIYIQYLREGHVVIKCLPPKMQVMQWLNRVFLNSKAPYEDPIISKIKHDPKDKEKNPWKNSDKNSESFYSKQLYLHLQNEE